MSPTEVIEYLKTNHNYDWTTATDRAQIMRAATRNYRLWQTAHASEQREKGGNTIALGLDRTAILGYHIVLERHVTRSVGGVPTTTTNRVSLFVNGRAGQNVNDIVAFALGLAERQGVGESGRRGVDVIFTGTLDSQGEQGTIRAVYENGVPGAALAPLRGEQ